jgi:all-trans-retinol dehydrogenase (NAD+)
MTQISGSTILVTGGAAGIGRRLALQAARLGARVVLWDLDESAMDRPLEEMRQAGSEAPAGYCCDVTDRDRVYKTAERVCRDIGPIDILVNNAGYVSGKRFLDCDDAQIERSLNVNTLAHFWTVKAFLPHMVEAGSGHIVTVASAAGMIGVAGLADYCASKWAAVGFNESLRVELKQLAPGVRTTVVCPYFVDTGMFAGVKTRLPWLLPILKEEVVADRILQAIRRNRAQLFLPRIVGFVPILRLLPARWFDTLSSTLGINRAMDTFVGHGSNEASPEPDEESARRQQH